MAAPIKKGVEYDCPMFEVRCTQPCVENGLRQTSNCPYDNYNSNSSKGANSMADKKTASKPNNTKANDSGFTPTFRKYNDMTDSEKAAFRQGAKTSENKVKERLGFSKPRD